MPWFDPQPTPAELAFWLLPEGQPHKVSRWPRPNSSRALDARYRLDGTVPGGDATASNYLIKVDRSGSNDPIPFPDDIRYGHFDIPTQVPFGLTIEMVPDPFDGMIAAVNIDYDPSAPIGGGPAIVATIHLETTAQPFGFDIFYEWALSGPRPWRYDPDFETYPWSHRSHANLGDWPWVDTEVYLRAVSDCYEFRPPVVPGGHAAFNGVDSYIKNRSRTNDTTGAWRQEFDIRLNALDPCDYFCKSFNTTRYCQITPTQIGWIGRFVTFTTPLVVGTWYHIDFRYQWDGADGLYRVAVDGGADATAANSNFNAKLDQFGKRASQAPRGTFDLKNFLFRNGTAVSSTVYLDQPFALDACDAGPDGRHGDTFNMTLPSCP